MDVKRAVERGMRKLDAGQPAVKDPQQRQHFIRTSRLAQVKNKSPAPVQITAEQILREAQEYVETPIEAPTHKIASAEELAEFRMRKRKEFEDAIRRNRLNIGAWIKYARWEGEQKEFERARSVYERALDVDYKNSTIWLKYTEMEMANKFINHARNLWDRAVALLPMVDQFWYKYAFMEEMIGNIQGARTVYERWTQWRPPAQAWNTYVKFEIRHNALDRARKVFERYVRAHQEPKTYIKWAKFETKHGKSTENARRVYERAIAELGEDANEELFVAFAKFEEVNKEVERARAIYRYALDHVPKHRAEDLYKTYTAFEKQFGDRSGVEDVILSKRRFQYEEDLRANPRNYDTWFDYIRLEETKGNPERIREVYERAIGQVPPLAEKQYWQRYIYLWINFALYEELEAKDLARARQIYAKCLEIIPHKQFTFAKLWLMAAHFEVRCKQLDAARRILGQSIGLCPREKIFRGYIDLETQLGNMDRVRKLYEKMLEWQPANCRAWADFAKLEDSLEEEERARGIYELAVNQSILDQPEVLWKSYIDFEIRREHPDNVRRLYKRLLQRTKHVKVWISRALFEAQQKEFEAARQVFREAETFFKQQNEGAKEERVMLIESWLDFERNYGTAETIDAISKKLPRKVKKRRELKAEDGAILGVEEYWDYIFPDEEASQAGLKILEQARRWKKMKQMQQQQAGAGAGAGADDAS